MSSDITKLAELFELVESESLSELRKAFKSPPREPKKVGFYLRGDESDTELIFRYATKLLCDGGQMLGFEDKYLHEMVWKVKEVGWIPKRAKLGLDVMSKHSPLGDPKLFEDSSPNIAAYEAFRDRYDGYVKEFEALFTSKNYALLQPQMPVGDTFFLMKIPLESLEAWNGIDFGEGLGWGAPDWSLYWSFLRYCVAIPDEIEEPEIS